MPVFPIDEAQLVALFMQSVTYGVHVVTFTICMWKLVKKFRSGQGSAHWPWTVIALFANGTVDVSFNLYHNLIAFIFYRGNGGAEEEFTASSTWLNLIRNMETVMDEKKTMIPIIIVIYTTTITDNIVCTVTLAESVSLLGLTNISLELAGIVFDLIIIWISQGTATEQTQAFTVTSWSVGFFSRISIMVVKLRDPRCSVSTHEVYLMIASSNSSQWTMSSSLGAIDRMRNMSMTCSRLLARKRYFVKIGSQFEWWKYLVEDFTKNLDRKTIDRVLCINGHPNVREGVTQFYQQQQCLRISEMDIRHVDEP
ncbi:predicted protein [Postia placenta Mad-698-R]|nr:predicted protein [Postia placenta Mad-698-R]